MHTPPNTPNHHKIHTTSKGVHIGGAYFNPPKMSRFEEDLQNALLNYKIETQKNYLHTFIMTLWDKIK